jgi:hypothetical protein
MSSRRRRLAVDAAAAATSSRRRCLVLDAAAAAASSRRRRSGARRRRRLALDAAAAAASSRRRRSGARHWHSYLVSPHARCQAVGKRERRARTSAVEEGAGEGGLRARRAEERSRGTSGGEVERIFCNTVRYRFTQRPKISDAKKRPCCLKPSALHALGPICHGRLY